jgi:hypothetical protein
VAAFVTGFRRFAVLVLLTGPSICPRAQSVEAKPYISVAVRDLSLDIPQNWQAIEDSSQGGIVTLRLCPVSTDSLYKDKCQSLEDLDPKRAASDGPSGVITIVVAGIDHPLSYREQFEMAYSFSPYDVPWLSSGRPASPSILFMKYGSDDSMTFSWTVVGEGELHYRVEQVAVGKAIGNPLVIVKAEIFDAARSSLILETLGKALQTLKVPHTPSSSWLFGQPPLGLILSGLWFWCFVGILGVLMLTSGYVRPRFELRYSVIAGTIVFYLVYIQLIVVVTVCFYLVCRSVSWLLLAFSIWTMPYCPLQTFVYRMSAAVDGCAFLVVVVFAFTFARSQFRTLKSQRKTVLLRADARAHTELWRTINASAGSTDATPFERIVITREPLVHVEGSLSGKSRLWLGYPLAALMDAMHLGAVLKHEASHNDQGALLFYKANSVVVGRIHQQRAALKEKINSLGEDTSYSLDPNTGIPVWALLRMLTGTLFVSCSKVVAELLRRLDSLISPLQWRFELYCDSEAAKKHGRMVFAEGLLEASLLQLAWIVHLRRNNGVLPSDCLGVYRTNRDEAKVRLLASLKNREQCVGHPPLTDRLDALGFELSKQLDLLGNSGVADFQQRGTSLLDGFADISCELQKKCSTLEAKATGNPIALATLEGAGLVAWSVGALSESAKPARDVKLKKKWFNRVKSNTGFQVKIRVSKRYVEYRADGRSVVMALETGSSKGVLRICHDPAWRWKAPFSGDTISDEHRSEVLRNVISALKFRNYRLEN